MKYILTTCGLSILTNGLKNYKISSKEIYEIANLTEGEIKEKREFLKRFERAFESLKKNILDKNSDEIKKLSAELNALITFYNGNFNKQDYHKILSTDTYLGKKSAKLVEFYLRNREGLQQIELYSPKDLKTSDIDSFHLSLSEIVKDLSDELEAYKDNNYEIIFNLTGGFKSVNSFLQTMASLYADKSIYIFETGGELLTIPRIPIKVDDTIIVNNLNLFRALEIGLEIDRDKIEKIPKTLINEIDNDFILSVWGEIIWQKIKEEQYRKELIKPIQEIIYSDEFIKDVRKLNSKEIYQINKIIDKLERFQAFNRNDKSLNFHSLSGKISEKYSYECYPFDGNDSRRLYCNKENNKVILEKIDAHLNKWVNFSYYIF